MADKEWLRPGAMVMLTRMIHRTSWCVGTRSMKDISYEIKQPVQFNRINGYGQASITVRTLTGLESRTVPLDKLSPLPSPVDAKGDPLPPLEPNYSEDA